MLCRWMVMCTIFIFDYETNMQDNRKLLTSAYELHLKYGGGSLIKSDNRKVLDSHRLIRKAIRTPIAINQRISLVHQCS